jgi:hypothetical protein
MACNRPELYHRRQNLCIPALTPSLASICEYGELHSNPYSTCLPCSLGHCDQRSVPESSLTLTSPMQTLDLYHIWPVLSLCTCSCSLHGLMSHHIHWVHHWCTMICRYWYGRAMGAGDDPGGKARMHGEIGRERAATKHTRSPSLAAPEMMRPDGLIRWLTRCLLRVARCEWMALECR